MIHMTFDEIIAAVQKERKKTEPMNKYFRDILANRGFIDDVIMPHGTRRRVCRALATLETKKLENPWRKHGNVPL